MKLASSSIIAVALSSSILAANGVTLVPGGNCISTSCQCTVDVKATECPPWFTEYFGKDANLQKNEQTGIAFCLSTSQSNLFFNDESDKPCGSTKPTIWPNSVTDATIAPTTSPTKAPPTPSAPPAPSPASATSYVVSTIVIAGLSLVLA